MSSFAQKLSGAADTQHAETSTSCIAVRTYDDFDFMHWTFSGFQPVCQLTYHFDGVDLRRENLQSQCKHLPARVFDCVAALFEVLAVTRIVIERGEMAVAISHDRYGSVGKALLRTVENHLFVGADVVHWHTSIEPHWTEESKSKEACVDVSLEYVSSMLADLFRSEPLRDRQLPRA